MTSKERVKRALDHNEPDRVPVYDAPWDSTLERWKKEGLPNNIMIEDYFGYDIKTFLPDISLQFPYEVVGQTDQYIIEKNTYGELIKNFKNKSTTPQILNSPIKNRKDWDKLKSRLRVNKRRGLSTHNALDFSETISLKDGLKLFEKDYKKGKFILFGAIVGFDLVQRYVGMERLLMAIIDDPEWVKDMFFENAKFILDMFDYMTKMGYKFDGIFIFDDLGYKNATLISPKHYKELIFEADKLICEYFHMRDLKVILHSCGCVKELIPYFIEAGIDCLQPLEVKAGMDLIELKNKYGNEIAFMGGIDTRLYSKEDPELVREEIKNKFEVAKISGGYIYHCDHSIPYDVSLSQYKKVLEYIKEYGKY